MSAPIKKAAPIQVSKQQRERFVVQSALLRLIDPVRGEPTRTSLDENPDGDTSGGQRLKQKFLSSFALICSTSESGAETASAVCLEQHVPSGAVLRIARNRGLSREDLTGLEKVLQILRDIARKEKPCLQGESEVLSLVAELDRGRILPMAVNIEKQRIGDVVREAHSRLLAGKVKLETTATSELTLWLASCPFKATLAQAWGPGTIASLIDWAAQARWDYPQQLRALFGLVDTKTPPWLDSLHKIARYKAAIKSMAKLAAKQPEVLAGIHIQEVKAPSSLKFCLSKEKKHLLTTVESLVDKGAAGMTMELLKKHLGTEDVEGRLRKACRLELTLHAEMQLAVFYEENPSLVPQMGFMGTSKKACFDCHEYLRHHPVGLRVEACHQKIYPSWMPPPYYTKVPGVYNKNAPFGRLSKSIEELLKKELKVALTAPRRPKTQDSTAGPSLTRTATAPTEWVPTTQALG